MNTEQPSDSCYRPAKGTRLTNALHRTPKYLTISPIHQRYHCIDQGNQYNGCSLTPTFSLAQLSDIDAGGATVFLDIEEFVHPQKVCLLTSEFTVPLAHQT